MAGLLFLAVGELNLLFIILKDDSRRENIRSFSFQEGKRQPSNHRVKPVATTCSGEWPWAFLSPPSVHWLPMLH